VRSFLAVLKKLIYSFSKTHGINTHLASFPSLNDINMLNPGNLDFRVRDGKQHVWKILKDQYFEGLEEDVWGYRIGGYQVCDKWLKDRI